MGKVGNDIKEKLCNQILYDKSSVFYVLTNKEKKYLKPHIIYESYQKKQKIYYAHEKPQGLICLVEGRVKIVIGEIAGKEQIIRIAKRLDFIGYRALFTGEKTIGAAVSLSDKTKTIRIPKKIIYKLVRSNAEFALGIIHSLAFNLGFSDKRIVSLTQKYLRGRLAESLLYLHKNFGLDANKRSINFYITRKDLADFSNMTSANAIRTLSDFAKEGLIELKNKNINILDLKALKKISKGI